VIIINDKPGQLCNQLWSYAPLIARALKYKVGFLTLYFEDNYHHFENLNYYNEIKFGLIKVDILDIYFRKILLNLVRRLPNSLLLMMNVFVDKKNWKVETWSEVNLKKDKVIIFTGTSYRRKDIELLNEFHVELTKIFRPKQVHIDKVLNRFSPQKLKYDIIIGVHIRRGDYIDFFNGQYYYDDKTYLQYMTKINKELNLMGKKVAFLICTNENINLKNFDQLSTFQISNASSIEDLYALSLCNYIMGPPSTFSMWASYYGKVPLRFLKYKNERIKLSEFSEIVAQDIFANGKTLIHV